MLKLATKVAGGPWQARSGIISETAATLRFLWGVKHVDSDGPYSGSGRNASAVCSSWVDRPGCEIASRRLHAAGQYQRSGVQRRALEEPAVCPLKDFIPVSTHKPALRTGRV